MPEDLIAYCGVDCAACADYTGGKCPGCRQTEWHEGDACLPVDCCRRKNIDSCGECPSFPCDDMQVFYRESESHEQAYQRMKSRRERMADEKKHNLYSRQKQLLDTFLGNGAITRAQYDKSLGDLTVKMGIEQPAKASEMNHFTDWDKVVPIDHGYDESKPESELSLEDMKGAAEFRGGECLSDAMAQGDWQSKLSFRCAFGHTFDASPRLVLEGGHWCPECERKSWNYGARAKVDPFFAQVWNPLHDPDEMREYPKEVTELDV